MATLDTVLSKAIELNWNIKSLLRLSTYKEYDDLSGLDVNYEDCEQLFILDELRTVMDKLADVENIIDRFSREQVAQDAGEKSGMAVTRYIALTKLLPELLDMVDAGAFSVSTAADYIADLPQTAQGWLLEVMGRLDCTPTAPQLARIKKYQQEDKLDVNVIDAILTEERPAPVKVTIKGERLKQYFPKEYTQSQVEEVIFSLLETWKVQQS